MKRREILLVLNVFCGVSYVKLKHVYVNNMYITYVFTINGHESPAGAAHKWGPL